MRAPILASLLSIVAFAPAFGQTAAAKAHHHPVKPAPAPSHSAVVGAPVVPAAPPPAAVIPPPDAVPPHVTPPPPPPPVHDDAPGETSKIADGLRLTFGHGRTDFNPATHAALLILAHTGQASPNVVYNLYAHAEGTPEDNSTPRRVSLERALAVRAALINAGIASTRIYVHAMGMIGADTGGPADRVDVTLATMDTTPPEAVAAPAATTLVAPAPVAPPAAAPPATH